jgi:hypothetical protein
LADDGLADEQNHVGVFVREEARKIQENGKDYAAPEGIAEQDVKRRRGAKYDGERDALHTQKRQGLIEGLVNRICSSAGSHKEFILRW